MSPSKNRQKFQNSKSALNNSQTVGINFSEQKTEKYQYLKITQQSQKSIKIAPNDAQVPLGTKIQEPTVNIISITFE